MPDFQRVCFDLSGDPRLDVLVNRTRQELMVYSRRTRYIVKKSLKILLTSTSYSFILSAIIVILTIIIVLS